MSMRFYVLTVQHNKEKDAENRTAPKGYDTLNDAIKEFHRQMANDMGNVTLDWSLCMVINSDGLVHKMEKWVDKTATVIEPAIPVTE